VKNNKLLYIGIGGLVLGLASWLALNGGMNTESAQQASEKTKSKVRTHRQASGTRRTQVEPGRVNANIHEMTLKQLLARYSSIGSAFGRIDFLSKFEDEEPTPVQWEFLTKVGFSEKSVDVVEALLISADMSDNDVTTKAFFRKYHDEHPDPDIKELAGDLLEERD